MAERKAITSKLKLVLTYQNELGEPYEKSVQMRNLVNGADAANAFGTLYEEPITGIHEIVENEIHG